MSIRAVEGYSSTRVVFTIANRWRIILTRYELRTILLLAPALLTFELCQLAGAVAKGWLASWARAFAIVAKDLPRIARERREWAAQRRCGDGRVLAGGALPFNPRLLTGRLEQGAGAAVSAALALNWLLARPCLNHGPIGGGDEAQASPVDLALTVAAQLAFKLLGFAILALLAAGSAPPSSGS